MDVPLPHEVRVSGRRRQKFGYVCPTDTNWIQHLKQIDPIGPVNYWAPGTRFPAKNLAGEPILFLGKAKSPWGRRIVGWGMVIGQEELTLTDAWTRFGERNGVRSQSDLVERRRRLATGKADGQDMVPSTVVELKEWFEPPIDQESFGIEVKDQTVAGQRLDAAQWQAFRRATPRPKSKRQQGAIEQIERAIEARQQNRLEWFDEQVDQTIHLQSMDSTVMTLVTTRAAEDRDFQSDGTWILRIGSADRADGLSQATLNVAFTKRTPVAILRLISEKEVPAYKVLGVGILAANEQAHVEILGLPPGAANLIHIGLKELPREDVDQIMGGSEMRLMLQRRAASRPGQTVFRRQLMDAYEGRCAVTGCTVPAVLEAAHIMAYNGPLTDHVSNGLLLRSDIHTLFDRYLLTADPRTKRIELDSRLADTEYARYEGVKLKLPPLALFAPEANFLAAHAAKARAQWEGD